MCDKFIKPKSKYNHFKSNTQKEFGRSKHKELSNKNPDMNNIDGEFYGYIIEHNEKYDHFLLKCHFQLVFNDNQYSTGIKSNLLNNITMISWKKYLDKCS